jgi:hypothetical protein
MLHLEEKTKKNESFFIEKKVFATSNNGNV